jgi:hypothetical protein
MEMNLEAELKKEYRNWESWIDQIFNIFYSLIWSMGSCLLLTTNFVGLLSMVLVLGYEGGDFTFLELQSGFKIIVICCGSVSAFIVFIFQFPKKIRNIFDEVARNRLSRFKSIKLLRSF